MEIKGKLLIIDDEIGIRKGCRRVLEPAGFTVETAASFQEGLYKIRQEQFDMVLLDVMMPDGRGVDLLEPIHKQDPEAVAVVITGYATVELAVETIKRGAYDLITKPFTPDMLLMTVNRGLEKRRFSLDAKRLQELEQEARTLTEAKEQAEKLNEFKSAFVTMVAHELRSPVTGVQSLVRTMTRGMAGELTANQEELLARVETRLDFLLSLINDLLALAASKSLAAGNALQPVELRAVLQRVVDRYSDEAHSKGVTIGQSLSADVSLRASEDGLESILGNVIGNAVKYTPSGGQVRLEGTIDGGDMVLKVIDSGIGIAKEDVPHVGEEFFRARSAHKQGVPGTGLGISIACQYLEQYGGSLHIDSEEGKGTTVTLHLPLWPTQSSA